MAGIYIHIPFCRKKCDYCNFFSLATSRFRDAFTDALLREIELTRDYLPEEPIETIYFGGGTPSLLSVNDLSTILEKAQGTGHRAQGTGRRAQGAGHRAQGAGLNNSGSRIPYPESRIPDPVSRIQYRGSPEISLELNPEDVTPEYLALLSQTPVNRLSLGIQSFFDDDLRYLGRNHTAQQAMKALEQLLHFNPKTIPNPGSRIPDPVSRIAHPASHLSLDLIYGIPTLSDDRWRENLNRVISLGIPHLSAYALTVEEKTPLAWQIRKGADRRTGGQADGRTGGRADRRTGGQADRRTGGQADRRDGIADRGSGFRGAGRGAVRHPDGCDGEGGLRAV